MDVVLYTDASPPRPVNSRLDRHHGSSHQLRLSCFRKTRGLVDLQAKAMAKTVPKSFPVSLRVNVAPSERIGSHSGHSGPNGVRSNVVRIPDNLVDVALFGSRLPDDKCPGDVGAVSLVLGSKVEKQKIALLHNPGGSPRMRQRGAWARGDDRRKWGLFASLIAQRLLENSGDRKLGLSC